MKHMLALAVAVSAMLGSLTECRADTRLLWRTPTAGATIVANSQGNVVPLGQVDVSAHDRIRVVIVARRPTNISETTGFGAPFRIELSIGEGNEDLGLLDGGVFVLNPSSTNAGVPAHTVRATAVYDNPVITKLLVDAVGPTSGSQRTIVDIYVYGQTVTTANGQ